MLGVVLASWACALASRAQPIEKPGAQPGRGVHVIAEARRRPSALVEHAAAAKLIHMGLQHLGVHLQSQCYHCEPFLGAYAVRGCTRLGAITALLGHDRHRGERLRRA